MAGRPGGLMGGGARGALALAGDGGGETYFGRRSRLLGSAGSGC